MPSFTISDLLSMTDERLPFLIESYRTNIDSICCKSGDYVKKGDLIMVLHVSSRFEERYYINSPCNGYISFSFTTAKLIVPSVFLQRKIDFHMTLEHHFLSLRKRNTKLFNYDFDIQKDFISDDYRLNWKSEFCIFDSGNYHFQIELNFKEGNPILHFKYRLKETIKVNDSLCLFSEKDVTPFLQLKIVKSPHKLNGKLKEVDIILSELDLDLLLNNKFNFLYIIHANGDRSSFYENSVTLDTNHGIECLGQTISSFLFRKYVSSFKEAYNTYLTEYLPQKPNVTTTNKICFDICYLYLMHDTKNGYYKIGMSKEPQYREKTLQSEKPSIELVCTKELPSRDIARAFEAALHNVFAQKRIRGEWFELSNNDVAMLMKTFE